MWAYVFVDLGCLRRSGSAGSRADLVLYLLRTCQTVPHSGWAEDAPSGAPLPTPPHQLVLLSVSSSVVILEGVRWHLPLCNLHFFPDECSEHLLVGLLAICIPHLVKGLFRSFAHF